MAADAPLFVVLEDNACDECLTLRGLRIAHPAAETVVLRSRGDFSDWVQSAKRTPSLFLLDHKIPGLEGVEAIRELKSRAPFQNVPMCILSSTVTPEFQRRYKDAGAHRVDEKPMELDAYVTVVERIVEAVGAFLA